MQKRRIAIAFIIILTDTIGATAILPMLPIYVQEQFGATPLQAMLAIAIFYAAQLVSAPLMGKLSDRFGRRRLMIASQAGTVVAYLLFIFAAPLGEALGMVLGLSGGLVMVYAARLLDGVTGGNVSVAEAYASDVSDDRSRAQALGLIGGAAGLGHILGPALAVAVSGISLVAPIIGALVVSAVTLLLTILLLDETRTPNRATVRREAAPELSTLRLLTNRPVALVLTLAFVISLYIATVYSSFSVFAERVIFAGQPAAIVIRNVNLIIILMGLATAISQIFLIAPLVRRWGEQTLIVAGSVLLLGSALGISSGTVELATISILAYAIGFAITWPSLQAIMTRLSSGETVGRQLGLVQSAFSLAFIVSPIIAGFVLERINAHAIFYNGALLMGLAIFISGIVHRITVHGDGALQSERRAAVEPQQVVRHFHH